MGKENNEFDLSKEPQEIIDVFKRSSYYNEKENLKGNELKKAFEKFKELYDKFNKETPFEKTEPVTLKELNNDKKVYELAPKEK
jgi:hypothetical protein